MGIPITEVEKLIDAILKANKLDKEQIVKTDDVVREFKVSKQTLHKFVHDGLLPAMRLSPACNAPYIFLVGDIRKLFVKINLEQQYKGFRKRNLPAKEL